MAGYITYSNQNATRNEPISDDLLKRLKYLQDMGITANVFSGGQESNEPGVGTGSTRHNHGNAADVFFYKDGRKLDWGNPDDLPTFEQIVSQGKANGITGFGAGPGYMQQGSMHIGMGAPGVWGADGKSKNAPDWLKAAFNGTAAPKSDPVAEVVAAASNSPSSPQSAQSPSGPILAVNADAPKKPESHNGILVDAYNKITGSNVQVPNKILGADTNKFMKGISGLGDFAAALAQNDQNLNNQIASAAQKGAAARANAQPVEMQFIPTIVQTRKKRGGIGGLGGYVV